MKRVTRPIWECIPGDQAHHTYEVTNNTAFTATLNVTASSGQNARMSTNDGASCLPPDFDTSVCNGDQNDDPCCTASSISNPVDGDHFPIAFLEDLPPDGMLPLPADPLTYVQPDLVKAIVIAPGATQRIVVAQRTYGACSDGSCAENLVVVEGTLADVGNTAVVACGGGGLVVNANVLLPHNIPAASDWGLMVMGLLVLVAGTLVQSRRHSVPA